MKKEKFDFEKFSKKVHEGLYSSKPLLGQGGLFAPLIKQFLEAALEGEMLAHLKQEDYLRGCNDSRNASMPRNFRRFQKRQII